MPTPTIFFVPHLFPPILNEGRSSWQISEDVAYWLREDRRGDGVRPLMTSKEDGPSLRVFSRLWGCSHVWRPDRREINSRAFPWLELTKGPCPPLPISPPVQSTIDLLRSPNDQHYRRNEHYQHWMRDVPLSVSLWCWGNLNCAAAAPFSSTRHLPFAFYGCIRLIRLILFERTLGEDVKIASDKSRLSFEWGLPFWCSVDRAEGGWLI